MLAATCWILCTRIQHHRADVFEGATAELAGEVAVNPSFVGLVVTAVGVVHAGVHQKRAEVVVLLSAMDAEERPFLIALEERVFATPVGMMQTRIRQQRPRVVVLLTAVFAVFAH